MATTIAPEKERSELSTLLNKNIEPSGLTPEEFTRAFQLILNPEYSTNNCWACQTLHYAEPEEKKSIYDTGLCQSHASYALIRRK